MADSLGHPLPLARRDRQPPQCLLRTCSLRRGTFRLAPRSIVGATAGSVPPEMRASRRSDDASRGGIVTPRREREWASCADAAGLLRGSDTAHLYLHAVAWDLDGDGWQGVLGVSERCVRCWIRDAAEVSDVAMQAVERLLRIEQNGHSLPGDLEAFTWIVTSRVAQDHLRARQRVQCRTHDAARKVDIGGVAARASGRARTSADSPFQQGLFDLPTPTRATLPPCARSNARAVPSW